MIVSLDSSRMLSRCDRWCASSTSCASVVFVSNETMIRTLEALHIPQPSLKKCADKICEAVLD